MTVTAPPRPPRPSDPVTHGEFDALVEALIEEARQRGRRRRRRRAAIVTLVALLGAALFALLGRSAQSQTASMTDTAAAPTGTSATRIKLRIHLEGELERGQLNRTAKFHAVGRGRFTLSGATFTRSGGIFTRSGAISDRGTFVDRFYSVNVGPDPYVRRLVGEKGVIRTTDNGEGLWRVVEGTKAYAGLRGQGRVWGQYVPTIDLTMTGTLSR